MYHKFLLHFDLILWEITYIQNSSRIHLCVFKCIPWNTLVYVEQFEALVSLFAKSQVVFQY